MEISANSLVSSSTMDVSTFPVDVVVYVCVQPSVICFSCLPTSKVECLLRLPSFELAFSSKGTSQELVSEGVTSSEVQKGQCTNIQEAHTKSYSQINHLHNTFGLEVIYWYTNVTHYLKMIIM